MTSVAIIGPGAIGGSLAGALIEVGHDPTLIVRTPFERLRVEWPAGEIDVPASCITTASEIVPADVVIVATKATHNAAIAAEVRAATRPGGVLAIAQNGVDHVERFAGVVGDDVTVVPAVPMLPASRPKPGHIIAGSPSRLVVPAGSGAERVAALFQDSFVTIEVSDDWLSRAWTKLILNAASGGIGVLTRTGSQIFTDPDAQQLLLALMEEVAMVGRAEGARLPEELPRQLQEFSIAKAGGHTSSIIVDRIAGQPTEWRERNDVVVQTARKHGLEVPLNHAVATLMRLGEPPAHPAPLAPSTDGSRTNV